MLEPDAGELFSGSPADGVPSPLRLSLYAEAIELHEPFDRSVRGESPRRELLNAVGRWLLRDAGLEARLLPSADEDQWPLIKRLLTLRPARPIPPDMLQMLDTLFADDASRRTVVTLGDVLERPNAPSELWPSAPILEQLLPEIDRTTQTLRDARLAPSCPRCGGTVFFNVRGGDWFVEDPWRRQFNTLREWLPSASNERLLVLDIGSGFRPAAASSVA